MTAHMKANFIHAVVLAVFGLAAVIIGVIPIKNIFQEIKIIFMVIILIFSIFYAYMPRILKRRFFKLRNPKYKKFIRLLCSFLTCFAGGVVLGVCILMILFDVKHHFHYIELKINYPIVELCVGSGLLLMIIIDDLLKRSFPESHGGHGHDHNSHAPVTRLTSDQSVLSQDSLPEPPRHPGVVHKISVTSTISIDSTREIFEEEEDSNAKVCCVRKNKIRIMLIIIPYTIHAWFEGFAFGAADQSLNIISLFFGIMVHKTLIMYSSGVKLMHKYPDSPIKFAIIIILMSLVTPIGAAIGYILTHVEYNNEVRDYITSILESFSIAILLFESAFEILVEEREHHPRYTVWQWLSFSIGFIAIALILIAKAHMD